MLAHDHFADTNKSEFVKLAHAYGDLFPDFLKEASEDIFERQHIDARLYADTSRQQFPCDTKLNTYLSALYYQEKRASFQPKDRDLIDKRLSGFVNHFGIKEAVAALTARRNALTKTASVTELPDDCYAYIRTDAGVKERRMRIASAPEVKEAAAYLEAHRDNFDFADRHKIAKRILQKAASLGAVVGNREFLEKQAGMGIPNPERLQAMLKQRSRHMEALPELKVAFDAMAMEVVTAPKAALQPASLIKMAETVALADQLTGHTARYRDGFARPEDIIFEETYSKIAAEGAALVTLTTGRTYEKKAMLRAPKEELAALFGPSFVEAISDGGSFDQEKFAELAATLPSDDAARLEGLLSDAGVAPLFHEKAANHNGKLPAEVMVELARQYAATLPT